MRRLSEFFNRLRSLFRSRSVSRKVNAELEQHLEFMIEDYIAEGMSPEEARRKARMKFGNAEVHKEDARDSWGNRSILDFFRNFRFGLRLCRRFPESSVLAVIVLAFGIGISAIIFTLSAKLLDLNAGGDIGDRQVYVRWVGKDGGYEWPTPREYKALLAANQTMESLYALQEVGFSFHPRGREEEERQVAGVLASGNFFGLSAEEPILGRTFLPSDLSAEDDAPIVISDFLWTEFYDRNPSAVGSVAMVNGQPRRIIGVMPPQFTFPTNHQIWQPEDWRKFDSTPPDLAPRFLVCGTLKKGVSLDQSSAEFETLGAALMKEFPKGGAAPTAQRMTLGPLRDLFVSLGMLVIMSIGIVGAVLVLLLCASNVFHIIMARTARRAHELATRCSLGAPRSHVVIQVLIDGVTLSLLGAGLGLLLAKAGLEYITLRLAIFDLPGPLTFQLSPKVVWFALGAAIFSGMVSALIPAWRASRIDAFAALKDEARGSASVHSGRLSRGLLTLQVGGSALLLWIGVVALGELSIVKQLKMSFDPATVTTAELRLRKDPALKDPVAAVRFCEALEDRLNTIPGIRGAAITSAEYGVMPTGARFEFEGRETQGENQGGQIEFVSPRLLDVFGLEPLSGRMLRRGDNEDSLKVCVVNEDFVRKYFANAEPLGAQFTLQRGRDREPLELTVVGVIPDIKPQLPEPIAQSVQNPFARVYVSLAQQPVFRPTVLIGAVDASNHQYSRAVREAVRDLSPLVRIEGRIMTVSERMGLMDSLGGLIQTAAQVFGAAIFITAIIGLYSIVSFTTNQRRKEIGIRLALGANGWNIARSVMLPWMKLIAIGVGLGFVGICVLFGGLVSMGGETSNPNEGVQYLSFVLSLGIVWAVVVFACLLAMAAPVWRAARLDPMDVISSD